MYNEYFLHMSKTLQKYFFFSQGSNGAGNNEHQFTASSIKYKRWK